MSDDVKKSPSKIAIETAKENAFAEKEITTLSSGVRVKISRVGSGTLTQATSKLRAPQVPEVWDEDKQRFLRNPNDPGYEADMEQWQVERANLIIDTIVILGVELIDPIPEPEEIDGQIVQPNWMRKLRLLDKRGVLNLEDFDLDDEFERHYLYVRHFAAADDKDFAVISERAGLRPEDVEESQDSFRG